MGFLEGLFSLGARLNKSGGQAADEQTEGVTSALVPELTLSMKDEDLLSLKNQWEKVWANGKGELEKSQTRNEDYWKGKHFTTEDYSASDRPLADNLLFEALETFLPIATRQRPDPLVEADNTPEGIALADKVQKMLAYLADTLFLKLKLKKATRFWALYLFAVAKVGWSEVKNEIDVRIIRPQKLILDPDATISEGGEYTGEFIGEYRQDSAGNLIKRFPKKKEYITQSVNGKLATEITYIEWWTDEYVFWTLENEVLDKHKNPHWNYESEKKVTDEFGNQTIQKTPGNNHFPIPKKPYTFLSVFNLGKHPWDDTNLLEQNIALQDLINKRLRQIDKNADNMNGGLAVSGDHFTKEQASAAAEALRKGGVIWVPNGNVNDSVQRMAGTPLPGDVYQSLLDYRGELKNIFGIRASSPQGLASEQTVRGKIMARTQDESRIGGGITEYIEQFTDSIFNWMVQLMYVYYDEPHVASVLGKERAKEYITIRNTDFNRSLLVSVKEGSLIPKDPLTKRNEALDLWAAGAIDPITLFDRLEFPNPRESAKNLYLWKTNPAAFFPDLQPAQQGDSQATFVQGSGPGGQAGGMSAAPDANQIAAMVPQIQSDLAQVPLQ